MELPTPGEENHVAGARLPARSRDFRFKWQYGAASVAAAYCEVRGYIAHPPGEWQHGWHPAYHNVHPELVVGTSGESIKQRESKKFWVGREDQAHYLQDCGYRHAVAIGLPITYLPVARASRMHGSLLVMPVHSLATTNHKWGFEEYVESIVAIKDRFSSVVACIHPICFERGYWIGAFKKRGIPVVTGAERFDRHGLERMAVLLSRFEYVTSNGFGSHLAYSAYCGAKPSIFGPLAHYAAEDFKGDGIYKNCPDLLPIILHFNSEKALRMNHQDLFTDPWLARQRRDWGKNELGETCRLSPHALKIQFGWRFRDRTASFVGKLPSSAKTCAAQMARLILRSSSHSVGIDSRAGGA